MTAPLSPRLLTAGIIAPLKKIDVPFVAQLSLLNMTLSARNRLKGQIVELELGEVMAHVVVKVGDNLVESVITKRSAQEMKLKVGDTVSAIIKSTEVMLEK
jgi:molybdopterin-binding protein